MPCFPNNATQNSTSFRTASQSTHAEPKAIPHTTRSHAGPNRTKTEVIPRPLHTCHSMRNPMLTLVSSPQIPMSFRTLTKFSPPSALGSSAWRPRQHRNGPKVSWHSAKCRKFTTLPKMPQCANQCQTHSAKCPHSRHTNKIVMRKSILDSFRKVCPKQPNTSQLAIMFGAHSTKCPVLDPTPKNHNRQIEFGHIPQSAQFWTQPKMSQLANWQILCGHFPHNG